MRPRGTAPLLLILIACVSVSALGQLASTRIAYVGVKRCQSCHSSKSMGRQYRIWQKGPHAKAYKTLGSDKAQRIADSLGVEDPQKNSKCLQCHVTAFRVRPERLARAFSIKSGVGCEACHGPGEVYATSRMMRAVANGLQDPAEIGLTSRPPEKLCVTCHSDRSPTYRPFGYETAKRGIAHPRPKTTSP